MKIFLFSALFTLSLFTSESFANCKDGCILKNRSQDQDCTLEKTPLTRCDKFTTYMNLDKKLNTSYRDLIKQLDKKSTPNLRTSQLAWIKWRDETCDDAEQAANCSNGVCAGVAHDSCILTLTRQRTKELSEFRNDIRIAMDRTFSFSKTYTED